MGRRARERRGPRWRAVPQWTLNSGNGVLGGIAVPLGAWLVWIAGVSVWWVRGTTGTAPRPAESGVAG